MVNCFEQLLRHISEPREFQASRSRTSVAAMLLCFVGLSLALGSASIDSQVRSEESQFDPVDSRENVIISNSPFTPKAALRLQQKLVELASTYSQMKYVPYV